MCGPCIIKAKNSRLQVLQVSIKILCNMYDPESTSSPSAAGLLLLHVVVMCPPPQHVRCEMQSLVL